MENRETRYLGSTMQRLRRERGVTLSQATEGICSPAALSNFENGKSQLSAADMVGVVNRLQLDWSVFTPTTLRASSGTFSQAFGTLMAHRSYLAMQEFKQRMVLLEGNKRPEDRGGVFTADLYGHLYYPTLIPLAPDVPIKAADYLFRVDHWTVGDMTLAGALIKVRGELFASIADRMIKRANAHAQSRDALREDVPLMVQLALIQGRQNKFDAARELLAPVKKIGTVVDSGEFPMAMIRLAELVLTAWAAPAEMSARQADFQQLIRSFSLFGASTYLSEFVDWNDLVFMLTPQGGESDEA